MNGTLDKDDTATTDEDDLDPREAARLLAQTTREAQRKFDLSSPLLSLLGAAVVLVALGAVWLSVRTQHPYKGPTGPGLVVMYGILICWIIVVVRFRARATAGLSGRAVRQQRAEAATLVTALVAVSVFQGVLKSDGVSLSIVYGVYPLTAQLIVLGAIAAALQAGRENWPGFGVGIAVMLIAAGCAFASPRGVWLADGIGCSVTVLGFGAGQALMRRKARSAR